jgi:flagellar FliL protein
MDMADSTMQDDVRKPSRLPLILGVLMALAGGAGGFYAVYSGLILGDALHEESAPAGARSSAGDDSEDATTEIEPTVLDESVFVPLDPLVISLPPGSNSRHLRFRAQLEVPPEHEGVVRSILPRVIDVLNSYLRAVETSDFEKPAVLGRLRAQMLRRVQIVAGSDKVRDLLIMEFVLN